MAARLGTFLFWSCGRIQVVSRQQCYFWDRDAHHRVLRGAVPSYAYSTLFLTDALSLVRGGPSSRPENLKIQKVHVERHGIVLREVLP